MLDPVQIFVQAVQDKGKEFLRIVLIGPRELVGKPDDLFLQSVMLTHAVDVAYSKGHGGEESVVFFP
jgi:hypothetical protein